MIRALVARIPGQPVAQGRPRASVKGGRVHVRDPDTSRAWKKMAAWEFKAQMGNLEPHTGPLEAVLEFCFECPKSRHRKREPAEAEFRTQKPDIDNLIKAVLDAANGIVYTDDSQVVQVQAQKITLDQGEAPYVRAVFIPTDHEVARQPFP